MEKIRMLTTVITGNGEYLRLITTSWIGSVMKAAPGEVLKEESRIMDER